MKLTIVGSASAAPNPGSASSCYLLTGAAGQILLECGHGAAAKMLLYTALDQIRAIVISHMHPDHFFDLVPLKYLIKQSKSPRLPLYLPPTGPDILGGVAAGLGENGDFWSKAYDIEVFDPNSNLDLCGVTFSMASTHHFIPAWSMRIVDSVSGGVLGYSSDTSLTDSVVLHLRNSDILLAEASVTKQSLAPADQGHLTGGEAGLLAARATVRRLLLTHYPQAYSAKLLDEARQAFGGPCDLAVEGGQYTIEGAG